MVNVLKGDSVVRFMLMVSSVCMARYSGRLGEDLFRSGKIGKMAYACPKRLVHILHSKVSAKISINK